ncbi:MAG: SdiA-regulated domain-containing protein [Chitinophagaceae bacterium]|nr:SdiA-regulated domain-containing protein [Chitinophagaceae bacterium]
MDTCRSFFLLRNLLICATSLLFASCGASGPKNYPSPPQYDLNHPYKISLPEELKEISGIEYYAKDTSIFAIADNDGWLFKLFLKNAGKPERWKFGKNHDYEDLQRVDSIFYVLSSSGDITSIRFYPRGDSMATNKFKFPAEGNNEFESMYYDSAGHCLNLLCKDCEADKKSAVSTWRFDLNTGTYTPSQLVLDVAPIAHALGAEKLKFKASATAIRPRTRELYILSSVNKALVIADTTGKVKAVYPLDPSIYKQPEGIAFTPAGDLLISNEVNLGEYATLLIFKNKIPGK